MGASNLNFETMPQIKNFRRAANSLDIPLRAIDLLKKKIHFHLQFQSLGLRTM